jgi:hypothetical protein
MPNKYLKIYIDDQQLQPQSVEEFPVSIAYKLEDPADFQTKTSSTALSVTVPATLNNDRTGNTFHNPSIEDFTPTEIYRNYRSVVVEAGSCEIFLGKAILTSASHTAKPQDYQYDFYGNNGDWIIPLKDKTLYDFIKHVQFLFLEETVSNSWNFDGTDPMLPYVFAPVRYGSPMESYVPTFLGLDPILDYNMTVNYMKPSISVYWILYWAFQSLGYKISSTFLDSEYFRRLIMPWTWGSFITAEGPLQDNLDFLAKSVNHFSHSGNFDDSYVDLDVSNVTTGGGFNNNNVYSYDASAKEMQWTYQGDYGLINVTFGLNIFLDSKITNRSYITVGSDWFINGVQQPSIRLADIKDERNVSANFTTSVSFDVNPGDIVTCKIKVHIFKSTVAGVLGTAEINDLYVEAFEFSYASIALGSTINFTNYNSFQNYKILDFIGGVVDLFNLQPGTDPVNKIVTFEPAHPYSLINDQSVKQDGYFNGNWIDWNEKQDLSQKSVISLFRDYDRQLTFKFKDDSNDGILTVVQKRSAANVGSCRYVLPERFTDEKQDIENRFFSPVMHYDVTQWKGLSSMFPNDAPQMCCIIPENISNTSKDESQYTFTPKIAWYKGRLDGLAWVYSGIVQTGYPYMFGVNYMAGGENDPILSYSDELIDPDNTKIIGKGLLSRFYLQRMAILRNGQYYDTFFRLNNNDVCNWLHREHIICRGEKWELVEIKDYKPLMETTTACTLRKWAPVAPADRDSVFPSASSVNGTLSSSTYDLKYQSLKCLHSDIISE